MRHMVLTAFLTLAVAGCYRHVVVLEGDKFPGGNADYNLWQHKFIGGAIGFNPIRLQDRCQSGVSAVVTKQSFLNLVLAGFTFGIYTPTTIRAWCKGSGTSGLTPLDGDAYAASDLLRHEAQAAALVGITP